MSQILKVGQKVQTVSSRMPCEVLQFLGGGGQGEVYRAKLGEKTVALKWYFPSYLQYDNRLRERLDKAIELGQPSDRFLWPIELSSSQGIPAFGYIMLLREPQYKSITDLMFRRVETSFRALATAGFELAHSFYQIHAKGLCYRDISFGNVFFDPKTGEIRICDNDNVDVNGQPGAIDGTPYFMAPEIVRGEASPGADTDLFSLSVLLFYLFHINHPLFGKRVMNIRSLDLPALKMLCGFEPVFIFDPSDDSNEPVSLSDDPYAEAGGNALEFWQVYPKFFRDLFIRAFTEGLRDPQHGRVRESEWRAAMIRLRDSIIYCPHCSKQNFYDAEALKANGGKPDLCWSCKEEIQLPPRIRIGKDVVMLNYDAKIYHYHIDKMYDFSQLDYSNAVGEMSQHPKNPNIWGIKNLSDNKWVITYADKRLNDVAPGQSVSLSVGTKINFGKEEGEIRC
jgi:eukaryotic-like serine/threonine-protein kinase